MIPILLFVAVDLPTSPNGSMVVAVIGVLFFLGALILLPLQIRHYADREPKRRLLPDPLNMRMSKDYITQAEFDRHEDQENRKFHEVSDSIERKFSEAFKAIDKEGKRLDGRVNDVLREVSKLSGAFNQSQRRHHPDD